MDVRDTYRTCPTCGHRFGQPDDPGRKCRFCSDACKQAAYRARKREREQTRSGPRTTPAAAPGTAPAAPPAARWPQPPRLVLRRLWWPPWAAHHPRPGRPRASPVPLRRLVRQGGLDRVPRGSRLPGQDQAAPRQVRPLARERSPRPWCSPARAHTRHPGSAHPIGPGAGRGELVPVSPGRRAGQQP
jgi:hypothetical protein